MKVKYLDYRELSGQNPLFSRYLYDYDSVDCLYHDPVHLNLDILKQRADLVISSPPPFPRDQLVEMTTTFNQKVGAGEETFRNLKKLRSSRAIAVVTGQQTGFLGGPALTIYKALTAVRLAQILNEEDYCAVPIFWVASDDSDFQEVDSTSFFDNNGELFPVKYGDPERDRAQMVGTISLKHVEKCMSDLQACGPKGEFKEEVLAILRETYHPTKNFGEALGSWLSRLFEPYGLVLFDPLMPGYKCGLKSSFKVAINQRREIVPTLMKRAELLREKGLSPQVKVLESESLIFWTEGKKRYKLRFEGKGVYEKKTVPSVELSGEELCNALDDEHLSPNVLLRPIVQDHLFPTVAYVGGPSEVAYFAQVGAISQFWNQEMAIFPRVGITIVDRKSQRLLKKYGVHASDFLQLTPEEIAHKAVQGGDLGKIMGKLSSLQKDVITQLESLRTDLQQADPTVAEMLVGSQKKIIYQIEKMEKRCVANHRTRTDHFGQHMDYLHSHLYPEGKYQERIVNFNQFMSEEGASLIKTLMETISPFHLGHHLIYL